MSGEDLRNTSANGGRLLGIVRESLEQKRFIGAQYLQHTFGKALLVGETAAAIMQLLPLFRATVFLF